MSDTIFGKIVSGEIPSEFLYEDEHCIAINDVNPQAPVHVLVIPKSRAESFADLRDADPEEVGNFMKGVSRVAAKLGLEQDGYRVVFNTGHNGLQTVQYIHAHILGGRRLKWPPG